jgi:hypothetical protein
MASGAAFDQGNRLTRFGLLHTLCKGVNLCAGAFLQVGFLKHRDIEGNAMPSQVTWLQR